MLSWRLKLREAEESFKRGRLDAAERLVHQHQLIRYRKGQRLAERLANSFAERAGEMAARGVVDEAWRDLARAKSLDARPDVVSKTENQLVQVGLSKARELLQSDEVERAQSWLADLELLGISDRRFDQYRRAADGFRNADSLVRSGRFVDAEDEIDNISELLPDLPTIAKRRKAIREQALECRRLTAELRSALTAEDWEQALAVADELLERTPQYKLARDARRRAVDEVARIKSSVPMTVGANVESIAVTGSETQIASADEMKEREATDLSSSRFILWVDGVGGFLTCLNSTLSIGQAVPDSLADIPIQGDISALHAIIKRVGDEYLLEPNSPVLVNGTPLREPSLLSDSDEIQLGDSVGLRFRRPHALSASARLDFVTRHRTHPWADAVILMAESCVLGPSKRNHIFCRDWRDDVVLFRQDDGLYCRAMESLEIDGQTHESSAPVRTNSRVAGEDFSITFETI